MGLKRNSLSGKSSCRVLVLGIGNTLRKDDGVGIHVIERLRRLGIAEDVKLLDGGTSGIDVVAYLEGIERLIIVDAVLMEGSPGDIRVFSPDGSIEEDYFLSGHYGKLSDILGMAEALWRRPETTVVGIIPKDCETYEIGLSPEVEKAADKAASIIMELVEDIRPRI